MLSSETISKTLSIVLVIDSLLLVCNLTLTFEELRYIFQLWDIVLPNTEQDTVTETRRIEAYL